MSSPCAAISGPPRPPTAAPSANEIIPTWGRDAEGRKILLTQDECIRRDTSAESLAALKPVFMPEGGSVTAGNSSPLNVGAAAVLIMSEDKAKELGLKPMVRIGPWRWPASIRP